MADKIRLLTEVVANQIAAGEVVNRPASAVKEMMENAIDAGASSVKVNFRDGGKELIHVVDDGCGMSPIDARMSFDRHATSKITSLEDIYKLQSFGFRGEALASIAAVAQVELRTRQAEAEMGTETIINGGTFASQKPIACAVGSQFFVRNLFYNVPARRRFLEKSTTSATQIRNEFQRVALCYPHIHFELYNNDAPIHNLPPTTLAGRIVDVVGRHIKQNLLEVEADTSIARVEGFIGRPSAAKKRNSEQYLFVNGRYFNSSSIYKAIAKGYEKLIPESCSPSYFLYLTIDPKCLDVNVHPQKTEVKFADPEAVWQIVNAAVRETLAKTGAVPMMDFDNGGGIEIPVLNRGGVYKEPRAASNSSYNPFRDEYIDRAAPVPDVDFAGFDLPFEDGRVAKVADYSNNNTYSSQLNDVVSTLAGDSELEFIPSLADPVQQQLHQPLVPTFSQVIPLNGGYAAASFSGRFVVVDLRRARERVLYENFMLMLGSGSSVSQQLLFPEQLVLSGDEYSLMEENAVEFAELGFDVEYQGDGTIEVRGTPADLPADAIDEMIYELLQAFDTQQSLADVRREKIALAMARGGSRTTPRMDTAEVVLLLDQLSSCDNYSFTPSGKALMTEITTEDIRAKLG